MKKNYSKPEILFEDFSVSCSIATCEEEANSADNVCGYYMTTLGKNVFVSGIDGCKYTEVTPFDGNGLDGQYGTLCYHVPGGYNLFGS